MSSLNQHIRLSDGRKLSYDERGPSSGKALFYFHGSPSCRTESNLFVGAALLASLEVRLIAIDRPGFGSSDPQSGRRILDWPQDVLALADHLQIERFSILAYSLGGPYGLACAFAIPDRLDRVGIVSGAALFTDTERMAQVNPRTRSFLTLPREKPWAARIFLAIMLGWMPRLAPEKFIAAAASALPAPDQKTVLSDPEFRRGFLDMVRTAVQGGTGAAYRESLLAVTDWGFRLEDIRMPVHLWHGALDQNIPVEMAHHAARAIPACDASFYPEEGHLSLFKNHAAEILRRLTEAST